MVIVLVIGVVSVGMLSVVGGVLCFGMVSVDVLKVVIVVGRGGGGSVLRLGRRPSRPA